MDRVSLPAHAPAAPAQPAGQPVADAATVTTRPNQAGRPVTTVQLGGEAAPAGERPAWLPAKFKDPSEMAAAYAALEQRMGSGGAPAIETPPAVPAAGAQLGLPVTPAPAATPTPALANEALQSKLTAAYAQTGQISPELRAEFREKTGLSDSFIDQQLQFMRSREQAAVGVAEKQLGSQQAVSELTQWAAENLSIPEREAFNRAVYSNDPHMVELAVAGLSAKYEAQMGRHPRVIAGRKPQQDFGGLTPFQSDAEWTEARRDARYKRDPAYRREVEDRLVLSQRLGLFT